MPLDSIEDYELLGLHLTEIDSTLVEFAERRGYVLAEPHSGGRYPNRRITQHAQIYRTIHISMDLTPRGERFVQFFPDIPYTIYGGVWIDDHDRGVRWHGPAIRLSAIPFRALVYMLKNHLEHFDAYLQTVPADYIIACDCSSALRG